MGCFASKPKAGGTTELTPTVEATAPSESKKEEDNKSQPAAEKTTSQSSIVKTTSGKEEAKKGEEETPLMDGVDLNDPKAAALAAASKLRTMGDKERMQEYIMGLKGNLGGEEGAVLKAVRCFLKYGVKPCIIIFMFYVWLFQKIFCIYKMLPTNCLGMVFGIGLCTCGGAFFATIAAAEAAINLGGADMFRHLEYVWVEGGKIGKASLADDEMDANDNKIPDVQEMGLNELVTHKAKVAMIAVEDPARFQQALMALLTVWIAVLAVLKIQFARTIAIVLALSNLMLPMAVRLLAPFLAGVMGKDLCHWAPTVITSTVKIIAIIIASMVQQFISAYYSGLRGGKMFALCLINILTERGIMDKLPEKLVGPKPFDPDESYLDEVIAYPLAAAGIYLQISSGFKLWFPFDWIFFPLTMVEWFIRFKIFT